MDDFIKRSDVYNMIDHALILTNGEFYGYCTEDIDVGSIPSANVRPIIMAHWILHDNGSGTCSNCKCRQMLIWDQDSIQHYCGNCGAKMEL